MNANSFWTVKRTSLEIAKEDGIFLVTSLDMIRPDCGITERSQNAVMRSVLETSLGARLTQLKRCLLSTAVTWICFLDDLHVN